MWFHGRTLLVMLLLLGLTAVAAAQQVLELTPELADQLQRNQTTRYFVKMDAGPCVGHDVCYILDKTLWEPLALRYPNELFTRLNCFRYRDLCNQLSTEDRVRSITGGRKVDFLTVAYSKTSPTSRLVELYRASDANPLAFAGYLRGIISNNLPFEAMEPSMIELQLASDPMYAMERRPVSLAVLVLTMDGFTQFEPWEAFAESSHTRVFVHQKQGISTNTSHPSGVIQVPSVFTHRGTISLVRAVIQLLRFALAYGGASHYVVVSGDSVPLVSPAAMMEALSKSNHTRFERHVQDQFKVSNEMRQKYSGEFRKSKVWAVFDDEAARFFADPVNDHTHNFDIVSMADEYYWINVAQEYNISWSDLPVMYDEWPRHVQAERPNTLTHVESASLRSQGHLFARKVTKDTVLDLDWLSKDTEGTVNPFCAINDLC